MTKTPTTEDIRAARLKVFEALDDIIDPGTFMDTGGMGDHSDFHPIINGVEYWVTFSYSPGPEGEEDE